MCCEEHRKEGGMSGAPTLKDSEREKKSQSRARLTGMGVG